MLVRFNLTLKNWADTLCYSLGYLINIIHWDTLSTSFTGTTVCPQNVNHYECVIHVSIHIQGRIDSMNITQGSALRAHVFSQVTSRISQSKIGFKWQLDTQTVRQTCMLPGSHQRFFHLFMRQSILHLTKVEVLDLFKNFMLTYRDLCPSNSSFVIIIIGY